MISRGSAVRQFHYHMQTFSDYCLQVAALFGQRTSRSCSFILLCNLIAGYSIVENSVGMYLQVLVYHLFMLYFTFLVFNIVMALILR